MLDRIRTWRRRRIVDRHAPPATLWAEVLDSLPLMTGLSAPARDQLRELATLFMHKVQVVPAEGVMLSERDRWCLAAQACLPILNLGLDWYETCATLVVYPGSFVARHHYRDEAGVEHEDVSPLSGEAWDSGPVVLSWEDAHGAGELDGYNVVIHEFTHKLDMLNGAANGHPPLHADMPGRDWTRAFTTAFEDFTNRVEQDEAPDVLDIYAAESPAEFFAVASESFFELPHRLRALYPAVYQQLSLFYRQTPADRLPS